MRRIGKGNEEGEWKGEMTTRKPKDRKGMRRKGEGEWEGEGEFEGELKKKE